MVLELPDVRQTTDFGCGAAVLRCVLEYHGMRGRAVPHTPLDGTAPDTLETALWQSGLTVQAGSMDVADLKYHTGRGRPVVALVTEPDGTAAGVGHWVVVAGVRRGFVWYACPLDGRCRERVASFEGRWSDQTRRGVVYARWGLAVGV